jgi:uncharacterized membrane protein YgcG
VKTLALRLVFALASLFSASIAFATALPVEPGPLWDPAGRLTATGSQSITKAVRQATRASGQSFLVVFGRPDDIETAELQKLTTLTWPDRNIVIVSPRDYFVSFHTTPATDAKLSSTATQDWAARIDHQFTKGPVQLETTVARVIGELGETAAGRPPPAWHPLAHPLLTLAGGRDATPWPWPAYLVVCLILVGLIGSLLYLFVKDPMAVIQGITFGALEGVVGAAFSGGGKSSGGDGFSGGGGSFGGGGASGKW